MKILLIIIGIAMIVCYLYFYNQNNSNCTDSIVGGLIVFLFTYLLLSNLSNSDLYSSQMGGSSSCATNCYNSHVPSGDNYKWLNALGHGKVMGIQFEEPINSGLWRNYTDDIWKIHCKVIDHRPSKLVQSHVDAFVGNNRFANLRFTFEDGSVLAPTKDFYELEKQYFENNGLCK